VADYLSEVTMSLLVMARWEFVFVKGQSLEKCVPLKYAVHQIELIM
jgi:hypothetical protein